jgi:hypothetical protein
MRDSSSREDTQKQLDAAIKKAIAERNAPVR